jgi:hypothetical protein
MIVAPGCHQKNINKGKENGGKEDGAAFSFPPTSFP